MPAIKRARRHGGGAAMAAVAVAAVAPEDEDDVDVATLTDEGDGDNGYGHGGESDDDVNEDNEDDDDDDDGSLVNDDAEDDDEDENAEVNVTEVVRRRRGQYHADLLEQHAAELKGSAPIPWIETLDVVGSLPTNVPNVDDDFQRELAFYKQALEAAVVGRERIVAAGVKFDRPADYFAEMLKTDTHMQKVRQHLADEAQQIKRSEEAAKQRAMRKYGKQMQAEKLQERAKQKTKHLEKMKMIRKGRANVDKALEDDGMAIDVEKGPSISGPRTQHAKKMSHAKGKHGGRNADSKKGHTRTFSGPSAGKKHAGKKRPGKTTRQRKHSSGSKAKSR